MNRLTRNNYTDDLFEKQKELIQVDEYTKIHYSQANYNEDLWKSVKEKENIEEQLGLTVEEMATILKELKYAFQIKICFNPLSNMINGMTKYDLVLRQPLSINSLPSERNQHISIDKALTDKECELYSKWLKEDKPK